MRTYSFKRLFEDIAYGVRLDPTNLQATDEQGIVATINRRTAEGVEHEYFAELMRYERRRYRPAYAGATAYAAGAEIYDPASDAYYQALRAATGQAPATSSGGGWVVNSAYWHPAQPAYSGEDWATGLELAAGDVVRNPANGEYYGCHTAHTAGGSFDGTKFGLLTPFIRSIDLAQADETPMGEVWRVTLRDPRIHPLNPGELKFSTRGSAIVLSGSCAPTQSWVSFRIRPPIFTREEYDSGAAYDAGDIVYVDALGECYEALETIDTGSNSPADQPAKWAVVEFPYILRRFVEAAAKAEIIGADGQPDAQKLQEAYAQLSQADDVATTGQGQHERATARGYC